MMRRAWNQGLPAAVVALLTLLAGPAHAQTPPPVQLPQLPGEAPPPPPPPSPPPSSMPGQPPSGVTIEPAQPQLAPVPPPPPAGPAVSLPIPASCERDKDCPGDLECRQHQCVEPTGRPMSPPPPPPVQVIYVAPPPEVLTATGLTFGVRAAAAFPTGNSSANSDLSSAYDFMIPFQLDAGYRLNRHWTVGGYVAVGFLDFAIPCDTGDGDSCSAVDIRFGVHAEYNFSPQKRLQPWVGAGLGWEIVNETIAGPDETASSDYGPDMHIDLGVDFRITPLWAVGPFFSASLGTFVDPANGTGFQDFHDWLTIGVRSRYDTPWLAR